MELRHIRYFLAVAEEESITKAAERVGIGQPPLSRQIKDLEREVGAQLFHRLAHGAELTDAGRAFRDSVSGVPGQIAEAARLARRAAKGETGALGLGSIGTAVINPIVSSAIRSYRRAYPDVEMRFEEATSAVLAAGLREGRLDAAILRPTQADTRDLRFHVLAQDVLMAALPTAHRLAAGSGPLSLSELRDETFIITPREIGAGMYDTVVEACRQSGFEPRFGQSAPQIATLLSLVAAEFGVSVLPAAARELGVVGVTFRPLKDKGPSLALTIAVRRDERSALVKNFVACARAAAKDGWPAR